ncbi:amino acid adenylation domain-containing protein [Chitinophaga sp. Mgbs1]|uniref:Amino acid adenylation domain-containing protein n=1 Tax=Chitinophaga solisilvae TaxID=1233460 RepID=A0A9Q5D383_9BACT|nr:amino acid adenylation domain-containing protein [Chitinophaga solisilvae]
MHYPDIEQLVATLREERVHLYLENNKLKADLQQGSHVALLERIKASKEDLIAHITQLHREIDPDGALQLIPSAGTLLTENQQQLWKVSKLDGGAAAYNIVLALDINGVPDVGRFRSALRALAQKHEALRTLIFEQEQQPLAFAVSPASVTPVMETADHRDSTDEASLINACIENERTTAFSFGRQPLYRTVLLSFADDRHCLLFTLHHLVCDGVSLNIIREDLLSLYLSAAAPVLPAPAFSEIMAAARWQTDSRKAAAAFWQELYSTDVPAAGWPDDFQAPAKPVFSGGVVSNIIAAGDLEQLRKICLSKSLTLFHGLFAIINTLQYLKTGQHDLVTGTVAAGRTDAAAQRAVGLFVNTLAVRQVIDPEESFADMLLKTGHLLRQVISHQHTPLTDILSHMRKNGISFPAPLFNIMVVLHNHTSETTARFEAAGLQLADRSPVQFNGDFTYTFNFTETAAGLNIDLEYNTTLNTAATAQEMLSHFTQLLHAVAENIQSPLKKLSFLTAAEERLRLQEWAGPVYPPTNDTTIQLFLQHAQEHPQQVAAVFETHQVTYGALAATAAFLAKTLQQKFGVAKDTRVMVIADRSHHMLMTLTGILMAGGAYVPVLPDWPVERIVYLARDTAPQVILVAEKYRHLLADTGLPVMITEELLAAAANAAPVAADSHAQGEDLAYIIYTSGSTGAPKGAMIEHAGMLNHLLAKMDCLLLNETCRIAQTASAAFDISVWQFFAPLITGGTCVIYEDDIVRNPGALAGRIAQDSITILELVPSYIPLLLEVPGVEKMLSSLKFMMVTGEALHVSTLVSWFAMFPHIPVVNAYGPTEASDDITHHIFYAPPADLRVPLGRPIRNLRLYVADSWGALMPAGVKGQILVSGIGVGRGYLNDKEKTARAFFPDPYAVDEPGRRMYATGDIGRWNKDGTLEFFGRKDEQVKIRGYRIELQEIEKNMAELLDTGMVAAGIRKDHTGTDRITAYIEKQSLTLSLQQLQSALRNRIPAYMIPSCWILVDTMPLTPNGKTDKRSLSAIPLEQAIGLHAELSSAILSDKEREVALIWSALLGEERRFTAGSHFFDEGGDSFTAIQLAAKLTAAFKVKINVDEIFAHPMLQEQALLAENSTEDTPGLCSVTEDGASYPVSDLQRGIYFNCRLQPDSIAYHLNFAFRAHGRIDRVKLTAAVNNLAVRHSILRTTFYEEKGVVYQQVHPHTGIVIKEEKMPAVPAFPPVHFDLSLGPLFSLTVWHDDNNNEWLILQLHHIICDGYSLGLIMRELQQLYTGVALPLPPYQYADYTRWQQEQGRSEMQRQLDFWLKKYLHFQVRPLFPETRTTAIKSTEAAVIQKEISPADREALLRFAAQSGITIPNILLGAWLVVLTKYTGEKDITIGMPVSGRGRHECFGIAGPFANIVPFSQSLDNNTRLTDLLQEVQQQSIAALGRQEFSYVSFKHQSGLLFSDDDHTLFDVAFSCEYSHAARKDDTVIAFGEELILEYTDIPQPMELKYKLHFRSMVFADAVSLRLEFRSATIAPPLAGKLMEGMLQVIHYITTGTTGTVGEAELLHVLPSPSAVPDQVPFNF